MKTRESRGAILGTNEEEATNYQIVVRGRLSERSGSAFAGMAIKPGNGTTTLVVAVQSHLFGVLERVRSLGLELIRVEMVSE